MNFAFAEHQVAKLLPDFRSFGNAFRNDMQSAFDRRFNRRYFLLGIDELLREIPDRLLAGLFPGVIRQRFQAPLQSSGSFRLSLRLEREVQILEFVFAVARENLGFEVLRQLPLFLDRRENGNAALFQIGVILTPLVDVPNLDFVEVAGRFFAISRNERNGPAFFE